MAVSEKRTLDETVHSAKNVLLDIEGTTTSISFVKDTLFPYVRKSLESYVTANWDKDEFKEVLKLLREQATSDVDSKVDGVVAIPSEGSADEQQAAVVSNVLWQMDLDRKTTALKQLQGLVWRLGYKDGELKGHVYPDVAPALRRWTESGRKLYVYSSGSVEAQKLLFKYSQEGDLSELFSGHFDTTVGPKVEADSYKAIVKTLDCNPDNVVFLTDVPKEAIAAREAGLPVVLVTRKDAQELTADEKGEFSSVSTLEDVVFSASAAKRQKVDETEAPKNGVTEESKEEKATEEKMDVEEEKETPKTEVADKEPKTEGVQKTEEKEGLKETAKTVSEEKTETKDESGEKMDDDSETKVEEKKPVEVEKKAEKAVEEKSTEEVKPVKESKSSEESPKTAKAESKEVVKDAKTTPIEKAEKSEKKEAEKVSTTEEVKPIETAKEKVEKSKTEEVKKVEEVVEKVEEVKEVKKSEATKEEKTEKAKETKEEKTEKAKEVEKAEEAKVEEKPEEKVDEKTVEKAEEAVEDKAVENKEVEKGVEAKEETDEKAPKQNGLENGVLKVSNGKSDETNGKAEENGVNGKEAHTEEVVVKKAAAAAPADAEMAAEA